MLYLISNNLRTPLNRLPVLLGDNKNGERMANINLSDAKRAKNDEFYTQFHDIEKEISAYIDFLNFK